MTLRRKNKKLITLNKYIFMWLIWKTIIEASRRIIIGKKNNISKKNYNGKNLCSQLKELYWESNIYIYILS